MIYSYRRVSTDDQQNGPAAQSDAAKSWMQRTFINPEKECRTDFFDNGVSGSVPLDKRPEGGKMCQKLANGDTVVVAKLDRLFRSVADAAVTIAEWNKRHIKMVALYEGFDMSTPMGLAMAQMASVFAELERSMIRERTRAALAAKKARGECVGEVPYGWCNVGGKLVESAHEQGVIGQIRDMWTAGKTKDAIARALNVGCVSAKKGGKWGKTQVQRVLQRAKSVV